MIDLTTVPCREEDGGITTWAQRVESELKALSPGRSLELGESVEFPALLAVSCLVSLRGFRMTDDFRCLFPSTEDDQRQIGTD